MFIAPVRRSGNTQFHNAYEASPAEPRHSAYPPRATGFGNPSAPPPGSYAAGLPAGAATDNPVMMAYALLQGSAGGGAQAQAAQQVSDNGLQKLLGLEGASTASASGQNAQELFDKQVGTKFGEDTADWALDNTVHEKQFNLAADMANKAIDNEHALSKKAADAMRVQ